MYIIFFLILIAGVIAFYFFVVHTPSEEEERKTKMTKGGNMKERIHEQITGELKQTTRTDTIVVLTGVVLNLLLLAINSGVAGATREYEWTEAGGRVETGTDPTTTLIMFILIALVIVINVVIVRALSRAKERRAKLTTGLLKMYKEEGMEKYYDPSIEKGYEARYNLFSVVVGSLGVTAVLVPLVIFVGGGF